MTGDLTSGRKSIARLATRTSHSVFRTEFVQHDNAAACGIREHQPGDTVHFAIEDESPAIRRPLRISSAGVAEAPGKSVNPGLPIYNPGDFAGGYRKNEMGSRSPNSASCDSA